MFNTLANFARKYVVEPVKKACTALKAVVTHPVTIGGGVLGVVSQAHADTTDPTGPIVTTATSYFGYLQTAVVALGALVLGIVIVGAVINMASHWLHKK